MDIIKKVKGNITKYKNIANNKNNNIIGKVSNSSNSELKKTKILIKINDISLSFDPEEISEGKMFKAHTDNEMSIQNIQISLFAYFKVFEKRFVDYFNLNILNYLVYYFSQNWFYL